MGRHGPRRFDRDSRDPPRIAAGENRPVAGRRQAKPPGRRRDRPAIPGASAGARDGSRVMTTETRVDVLEAKGLIHLAALRPELEYLFRHGLVQDAAYTSLLKQERRELHGRVGVALEELYPDRIGELAPVLAMHFEQAGDAERAIEYYLAGAQHALSRYAIQEAYAAFNRAAELIETQAGDGSVELAPAEMERRRRRRIEVELGRADAGGYFRAPDETFDALEGIVGPAEELGDMELIGRVHTLIALGRLQNAAAAQASALAGKSDLIAQLDAMIAESMVHSIKGDLGGAVPLARQCVEQSEETGATACMLASSWILGDAFYRQGKYAEARDVLKRGTDVAAVVDRKVWRPTLLAWLSSTQVALGAAEDGDWDEALATSRSIGNRVAETGILAKRAETAVARGDVDAARPDAEAAIAIGLELGLRPHVARIEQAWGEALRAAGNANEAEPHLRGAAALFAELGLEPEASAVRAELALGGM